MDINTAPNLFKPTKLKIQHKVIYLNKILINLIQIVNINKIIKKMKKLI